ncbi:agamous-like MADS-box protein AGL80 [Corylus avellana]|uniref:agamous-like MADS-box protein AGL80 n=1 Tax=Corylus avellana TaxID=13451 RepID=UPI001E21B331|nr:agamous-like MADS-box protein AGL80 [Corylus avellana]
MTRKKVKLAYITNDSARKSTFKKRKRGLLKKVSELSTLCGIEACAIIYSPYDSEPQVWPSPLGVQRVLARFKEMPELEQSKKMVNQESFLRQRIAKANEQLKKQRKDNREKEMTQVMFHSLMSTATGKGLQNLSIMDLNDLGWLIDQNLKEIYIRVDKLNKEPLNPPPPPPPTDDHGLMPRTSSSVDNHVQPDHHQMNMETMHRQRWFMDLMNPQEHMGFVGDEMMLPFADYNHNALWSTAFFP